METLLNDLIAASPLISLIIFTTLVMLVEAVMKQGERASYWLSLLGLSVSLILALSRMDSTGTAFSGMVEAGGTGQLFAALFASSALFTIVISRDYLVKQQSNYGEFYLLILFATAGMMLMASAADLIVLFLGLELMSVCLYVLAGFIRTRSIYNEAALKYFLLGAFATGFLLYGIALLYGTTGSTNIQMILNSFPRSAGSTAFWVGLGLLLSGFAFKVGAVPFHMWVPDVYQGSPTTVTGFMATGAKAAAFSVFIIMFANNAIVGDRIKMVLAVLATASMVLGNIVAIAQSNIKRMLAYSSIAHAGYMLVGLAAGNQAGREGILFYLVAYMFMNIGAFGILSILEGEEEKNLSFDDYAGLGSKRPFLAGLMAMFMISLAGIPPFGGFFGKYYVFSAAISADLTWLAIVGVLSSVVSVYYYLRLVTVMYFSEGSGQFDDRPSRLTIFALGVIALAILQLGVFPSMLLSIIQHLH